MILTELHYGLVKQHEIMEGSGSRNQVKSLLKKEEIELKMELPHSISFSINHCLFSIVT